MRAAVMPAAPLKASDAPAAEIGNQRLAGTARPLIGRRISPFAQPFAQFRASPGRSTA
jgi:hypothetical protein